MSGREPLSASRYADREWVFHDGVRCVECGGCGFTFDADHVDDLGPTKGRFSCPCCGVQESEVAAAIRESNRV